MAVTRHGLEMVRDRSWGQVSRHWRRTDVNVHEAVGVGVGDELVLRTVMCLDLQDPLKTNSYMFPSPCWQAVQVRVRAQDMEPIRLGSNLGSAPNQLSGSGRITSHPGGSVCSPGNWAYCYLTQESL